MSPSYMAARSRCAANCIHCSGLRSRARWLRVLGYLIQALAIALIALSFPVEGLAGAALGVTGMVTVWVGWYIAVKLRQRVLSGVGR
jgi:hypothetical protein